MDNRRIADIFNEIADILDIQGENPFRIRSYRTAARAVEDLSESLAAMIAEGRDLQTIPGIGKGTAEKIGEMVGSGKCSLLEELRKTIPPGLPDLLRLEGMGPKKVKLVYEKMGVDSLDSLERAARAGKIQALEGMGAKTEEKILRSIESFRKGAGRFLLSVVFTYAEAILSYLGDLKKVDRIIPAGSLRRRKETIGDLDILAACPSSCPIMEHFTRYPEAVEVIASGKSKSSIRLGNGLQVDLRVLSKESFGSALHYFTGSKPHNILIRERARARGLKVSEYGVFRIKDDARVAGKTEEDLFSSLSLSFIPPELREDRGEVEAAEKGGLPKLIEPSDILGDLQMHTTATDGKNSILEMAGKAKELGYRYIAVTEHSKAVRVARGLDEKALLKHFREIEKANSRLKGIRVLKGVEVDILPDGSLDLKNEVLKECEVVLASVHSRFTMGEEEMTRRIIRAMQNPAVNMLAHPTGRLLLEREPYSVNIKEIIQAAADHGVILEINAHPSRLDLRDVHARMAKEMGARIAINTDAHSANQLELMRYGVYTARRAWLEARDVVNTRPLRDLLKILNK